MPQPDGVVIRDLRSDDAATAVDIFADSFLDFPALQVMVGNDDGARTRTARMVRFMRIAGPCIFWTVRMFGLIERVHPKTPHRHLPTIGVDPGVQSRGIGSRLMEEFDRRCDADGVEAYPETIRWTDTGKPSHERFYGRLGYRVADVILMTDEWSVLTMRRPAGGVSVG